MIDQEEIVEFSTHERKIEHQYRTIKRLEPPNIHAVLKREEFFGVYECKDFI